jgi:hypothetical protein
MHFGSLKRLAPKFLLCSEKSGELIGVPPMTVAAIYLHT